MKVKTLCCPIFKPFHPPYAKLKSLSLHFFTFSKVSSLSQIKQINFCGTNCGLSSKTTKPKSSSMVTKHSKMLRQQSKIKCLKTFTLELDLSLISNKTPNLQSLICSEMDNASITNKRPL